MRVIAPDVGGSFGAKNGVYPEEILLAYLARALRRPLKWAETRTEHLALAKQGRDQTHDIELAVRSDGRVLGLKTEIRASNGAYAMWPYTAALDAGQASENVPGPYDIAAYEVQHAHIPPTGVLAKHVELEDCTDPVVREDSPSTVC